MNNGLVGEVFNIQHFSIHDGPGIRTLVHLKGCSLRCSWCCNPESQLAPREIGWRRSRCTGCGTCVSVCPERCVARVDDRVVIDRTRCTLCGKCVEQCPAEALVLFGRSMSVDEVVDVVSKDAAFYDEDGGVTVSGGEPCLQPEFAAAILEGSHARGFTTAIETAGHVAWSMMERVLRHVDFVLFDLKSADATGHRTHTGSDNTLLLENLGKIDQLGKRIWLRVPVIPGINDDNTAITGLIRVADGLRNLEQVDLLPFHQLGAAKYAMLDRVYPAAAIAPPSADSMRDIAQRLQAAGHKVTMGG